MLTRELLSRHEVEIHYFTWRRALIGRYDILHTHWPEILVSGNLGIKLARRQILFGILLVRLWLTKVAVVRTQHNVRPHENGRAIDDFLLRRLDTLTAWWVTLNGITETPDPARTTILLHGDYAEWFAHHPQPNAEVGRVLFAGLIKQYKNVPALITAFKGLQDQSYRLQIVGSPLSPELGRSIEDQARADNRITTALRYVTDAEMAWAVGSCELMVLPYAEMHNSGVALMALSMCRPILAPNNGLTQLLADEVGPGWVFRYDGDLKTSDIENALRDLRGRSRPSTPDLRARSWLNVATHHVDVYRAATQAIAVRRRAGSFNASRVSPKI